LLSSKVTFSLLLQPVDRIEMLVNEQLISPACGDGGSCMWACQIEPSLSF